MSSYSLARTLAAVALAVSVPATATAAVRPVAAVPTTASTAVIAQSGAETGAAVAWPAIAIIIVTALAALWITVDDDPDGEGAVSIG